MRKVNHISFVRFTAVLAFVFVGSLATAQETTVAKEVTSANFRIVTNVTNMVRTFEIKSEFQRTPNSLWILQPHPQTPDERFRVLYVLPVEAGDTKRWGDSLAEFVKLDLHNRHRLICVFPTFSDLPWFADHPTDAKLRQESWLTRVVVPFIDGACPTTRKASDRLLLGFSKSGWGAFTLLLRHPDMFGRAAAFDAPLMMDAPGKYGSGPIFGTADNFADYQVSRLLKKQAKLFQTQSRLILVGDKNFHTEHIAVHQLMDRLKIPHTHQSGGGREHSWNSGWAADAVQQLALANPEPRAIEAGGSIAGRLLDISGQPVTDRVPVFLCDAKSGHPIVKRDNKPLEQSNMTTDLSRLTHTYATDGQFKFDNLPPGRYRLVAQSWEGLSEIPTKKEDLGKDRPLVIRGHAIARVAANQTVKADIRAAGSATIHVKTDPDEGNAFLFPTTKKPIGDFVLGPIAWKDFGTQVLGVTHMARGKMTLKGLPNNSEIHFCYLNYDNAPGVGGGSCNTGRDTTVTINVYATWSNGKYDPPTRLLPLVEHLEAARISLRAALQMGKAVDMQGFRTSPEWKQLLANPTKKVTVGTAGEWTLLDIVAANSYRVLRAAHAARRKRTQSK